MVEKRLIFDYNFQRTLFKKICEEKGIKIKDICKILNVSYWTLKGWFSGRYTIPQSIIEKLLSLCSVRLKKEILNNVKEVKNSNWGQIKGARIILSRYTKKWLKKKMAYIRKFKRTKKLKIVFNKSFWELVGIIMGDGCLSKFFSKYDNQNRYEITITGNSKYDKEYYLYVVKLLNRVFEINPKVYTKQGENVIVIRMRNKQVFETFKKIGLPVGKKTKKLKMTNKMLKLPTEEKYRIIRGLFDTDGTLASRKDENYKYPYLIITTSSDRLRKQLKLVLRELGFPAYIHSKDVIVRGARNAKKWMKKIGTSHPVHKIRFNIWLKTSKLLPKEMGRWSNG